MNNENEMNILISINSKFVMPATVMLASLFKNNKEHITVYMLYSDLKLNEIKKIKEYIQSCGNKLILLKVSSKIFNSVPLGKHFSIETYYRLLAHKILPKNLKRILYLDSDLIINRSIEKFYNQDIGQNYFVCCEDIDISKKNKIIYKNLNLPRDIKYFNAGVLLYNLELIRKEVRFQKILDYISENKKNIVWVDQDVLNGMFYNKVKFDNFKLYNLKVSAVKKDKKSIEYVYHNSSIIHFTGSIKPWNREYNELFSRFLFGDLFWKYIHLTPYKHKYFYFRIGSLFNKILNLSSIYLRNE